MNDFNNENNSLDNNETNKDTSTFESNVVNNDSSKDASTYESNVVNNDSSKDASTYESNVVNNDSTPHAEGKVNKKHSANSFQKAIAFGLIFGLVAGTTFTGTSYLGNRLIKVEDGSSNQLEKTSTLKTTSGSSIVSTGVSSATTVTDVSDIVKNCMPSVVAITCVSQTEYYGMFGRPQTYNSESCGSGFIISEDEDKLYIATNNHVVSGAQSLTITFADETTAEGTIKGTDSSNDLAVVSVNKSDIKDETFNAIKVATLGDSDNLEVGSSSIAIGNALGYGQSVTTGVISALNREVTTSDETTGASITNELIQTDAAINPGNSGGALINMSGEVIGINSAKYTDQAVEGMGYAIPISTAKTILEKLMNSEKIDSAESGYLGINGSDINSQMAEMYSMPEGVYISSVTDGSAAKDAGMVTGDIIVKFDGEKISSLTGLQETLSYYKAGTTVDIEIKRNENGKYVEKTLSVKLGSKPADTQEKTTEDNSNSDSHTFNPSDFFDFGEGRGDDSQAS